RSGASLCRPPCATRGGPCTPAMSAAHRADTRATARSGPLLFRAIRGTADCSEARRAAPPFTHGPCRPARPRGDPGREDRVSPRAPAGVREGLPAGLRARAELPRGPATVRDASGPLRALRGSGRHVVALSELAPAVGDPALPAPRGRLVSRRRRPVDRDVSLPLRDDGADTRPRAGVAAQRIRRRQGRRASAAL